MDGSSREQRQQQATDLSQTSLCSPRRIKSKRIDIDAALYLQSQANYVQEPNNQRQQHPHSSSSSSSNHNQQHHKSFSSLSCGGGGGGGGGKTGLGNNTGATSVSYHNINSNYNRNNRRLNSNISVDYIDCCVPDIDTTQRVGASNSNNNSSHNEQNGMNTTSERNMRGIPSCRKHFQRFNRNRIEPQIQESAGSIDEDAKEPQQRQQSDITSSSDQSSININNNNNEQQQQNQQQQQPQSSILYPISISEVKKRGYFFGSVGQDSLLGEDELFRYFPNGRVNIFVCTWNQNRKRAPMNLNDLLLPSRLVYLPDIYAIGIQEAFSSQQDYLRDWDIELQTTLGPNHVLLHSCSLGVLHLSLFVRRDLIWFCSTPEESVYNSRSMPTNMIKTKGAVSIAFRFFGTSFMFTNCHFPPHENRLKDRIDEYQRIINSIDLPKNLKLLKPRYLSQDSTARFDCCFFMGDLNFRLEQRTFDETITIMEDIFQQKDPSYEVLTQNDELIKVMETDQAFHGFDESQIKFPPTYKFLAQTNKYDRQTKRVPSYTDRILFRSKRQRHIQCLLYDWLPQLMSSDHKPVYCLFDVLVRPGYEQNLIGSLNAGLFQRTVYLEALKRRADDPNGMRENGASGNLICSIS